MVRLLILGTLEVLLRHHHVWQYDRLYWICYFSRADRYEDWRGKIAIVRMYNRALSATEIKNHFELERGRFGV